MNRLAPALILATALAPAAWAQEARLGGQLVLPDGAPVVGYPVIVEFGDASQVFLTDQAGNWGAEMSVLGASGLPTDPAADGLMVRIPNGPVLPAAPFGVEGATEKVVVEPY